MIIKFINEDKSKKLYVDTEYREYAVVLGKWDDEYQTVLYQITAILNDIDETIDKLKKEKYKEVDIRK